MKTVVGIKIKNLSKYEKDWRRKKEAERLAEDPVTRCGKTKLMEMTKVESHMRSGKTKLMEITKVILTERQD